MDKSDMQQENIEKLIKELKQLTYYERTLVFLRYFSDEAQKRLPTQLLSLYEQKSSYFRSSKISLNESLLCEKVFVDILPPYYESIQLSPVMPIGSNSVITKLGQNSILSTMKSMEVLADPTTALAFEATLRIKEGFKQANLSTTARSLRMQKFDNPYFLQHFSAHALASATVTKFEYDFLSQKICEHIDIYLNYIQELTKHGYCFDAISVSFASVQVMNLIFDSLSEKAQQDFLRHSIDDSFDFIAQNHIEWPHWIMKPEDLPVITLDSKLQRIAQGAVKMLFERVICPLTIKYQNVHFYYDLAHKAGRGYYKNYCFHLDAKNKEGTQFTLVDGGDCDWGGLLLGNRKCRLIVSGFGAEIAQTKFKGVED